MEVAVAETIAGEGRKVRGWRKVRTPQGSAPGNTRAGQPDGPVAQKTYRPP